MRQGRRGGFRPGISVSKFAAGLSLAVLLAAAVTGATNAAAAPSPGYTASFIPASTGWTPQSVAVDTVTDTVYVGENSSTSHELVVMDGSSHAIEATLPLAGTTYDIAVNSVTDTVYVADAGHIDVIDGSTNTLTATIAMPAGIALGVAVDSATDTVYVAATGVVVINGSTNAVTTTVSSGGRAQAIAVDEATNVIWAVIVNGPVVAISGVTDTILHTVSMSYGAYVAVNPVTNTVYVSSLAGADPLTVIDGATGTIITTVPVTDTAFGRLAVDPTDNVVFAVGYASVNGTTAGGTIAIDGATNTVADVIGPAGYVAAMNPATDTLYETAYTNEPPGLWTVVPSASNAISPLISGPAAATTSTGSFFETNFSVVAGRPAPAVTETGSLPAGVTFSANGILSGTPAAGTAGVYPIRIAASNGVAPDWSQAFTLTVTQAPAAPAVAVGAEGTNGALFVQEPQLNVGWQSLGGRITGPPAVAAPPNPDSASPAAPLLIATGTDRHLYVRSLTAGWQKLSATASCLGPPAAVITGSLPAGPFTLTVACRGLDNALWQNSATLPASGLPTLTSGWTSLGGVLSAAPAVAPVGGAITFFVRGTNGRIFTRTLTAGYATTPWSCIGTPAAALQPATGITVFACQGTDHALWYATDPGTGWTPAASLGGILIGGPGIAATSSQIELYVEATNHSVVWRTPTSIWNDFAGRVVGGVSAVALN